MTISCTTSQKMEFDPNQDTQHFLHFGGGGGFTGKVTSYYLTDKGKLYSVNDTSYTKISTLPKATIDQIFKNYTTLGLDKIILNDPGNKYNFIEHKSGGESKMMKWGNSPMENKSILTFYNILMKYVKDAIPKVKENK
jgi:hypothetical protein